MYKKTIEFVDFNGTTRKEDFYFHISETELRKLELSINGGLHEYISRATEKQDVATLTELIDKLIDTAYGVKTLDGRGFVKTPENLLDFKSTEAYNVFYTELLSNDKSAAAFINGIFPKDLINNAKQAALKANTNFGNLSSESMNKVIDSLGSDN